MQSTTATIQNPYLDMETRIDMQALEDTWLGEGLRKALRTTSKLALSAMGFLADPEPFGKPAKSRKRSFERNSHTRVHYPHEDVSRCKRLQGFLAEPPNLIRSLSFYSSKRGYL